MPAVSKKQRAFIAANPDKFGGKAKADREWLVPTKGKKLPTRVAKKKK